MQYAINNIVRIGADEERIKEFVANNIIATYFWFLEFNSDDDERINVKEYIRWVHEYYINIYLKYIPEKEKLNKAFASQLKEKGFRESIPTHTFEQYMEMVGEGYNG